MRMLPDPEWYRTVLELTEACAVAKNLGDIDYSKPNKVFGEIYRRLIKARTDPDIRRDMMPIFDSFTPAQRQIFSPFTEAFEAIVAAETNASLARSIASELGFKSSKNLFAN